MEKEAPILYKINKIRTRRYLGVSLGQETVWRRYTTAILLRVSSDHERAPVMCAAILDSWLHTILILAGDILSDGSANRSALCLVFQF